MKASELRAKLDTIIAEHGDCDVFYVALDEWLNDDESPIDVAEYRPATVPTYGPGGQWHGDDELPPRVAIRCH